jgi:hypothetical protein
MLLLRDQLRPREGQARFRRWPPAASREGLRPRFEPSNGGVKARQVEPDRAEPITTMTQKEARNGS